MKSPLSSDMSKNSKHKWNTVNVFSEEKSALLKDAKLSKRTAKPLTLSEGLQLCSELEGRDHIVEIRKVS
tara:strand:- start:93 stop:302 length:210 start_codon:yes stop_codon:yes gene_type:complete